MLLRYLRLAPSAIKDRGVFWSQRYVFFVYGLIKKVI